MVRTKLMLLIVLATLSLVPSDSAAGGDATCFGRPATMVASRAVTTFGTGGRDIIAGNAGKNEIYGSSGHDLICGFGRRDIIHGGPGNDKLSGGPGTDAIEGELGERDEIFGGPGHDRCSQHVLAMTGSGGSGASKRTRSCELIL